ncbi:MAG: GNAT family N-acetyltransferase [Bacteroidales bacterium]
MKRNNIREKIRFREFTRDDFPEIQKLWEITGMGSPERSDTADTILNCNKLGGYFIVMYLPEKNKIIGTSWMTWDGRRTYIHHFGIHPDYQGLGLGKILGWESLKYIRKIGSQVKLEVHKKNDIAKNLYQKLGFFAFTDYDIYMIRKLEI